MPGTDWTSFVLGGEHTNEKQIYGYIHIYVHIPTHVERMRSHVCILRRLSVYAALHLFGFVNIGSNQLVLDQDQRR